MDTIRIKRQILLMVVFMVLLSHSVLAIPTDLNLPANTNLIFDNNCVMINDTNVDIKVCPYKLKDTNGYIDLYFTSKTYTGSIDFGFGTNENMSILSGKVYNPHIINIQNSRNCYGSYSNANYTLNIWYNYTINPNILNCYESIYVNASKNTTVYPIFSQEFSSYNISTSTIYWTDSRTENWTDLSVDSIINVDYLGSNKWYIMTNRSVTQNNSYHLRGLYDAKINSNGKYSFCIKPSSENLGGTHTYCLDPWWNNSWGRRVNITIGTVVIGQVNYAVPVWIKNYTGMESTWASIRFFNSSNSVLPYYLYWSNTTDALIYVNMAYLSTSNSQVIVMYYNNSLVNSTSNGFATFKIFDDFNNGATINASIWTSYPQSGTVVQGNGKLNLTCTGICNWYTDGANGATRVYTAIDNGNYTQFVMATQTNAPTTSERWGPFFANSGTDASTNLRFQSISRASSGVSNRLWEVTLNGGDNTLPWMINPGSPIYFKQQKLGSNFIGYYSTDGVTWLTTANLSRSNTGTMSVVGLATLIFDSSHTQKIYYDNFIVTKALATEATITIGTAEIVANCGYVDTGLWIYADLGECIISTPLIKTSGDMAITGGGTLIIDTTNVIMPNGSRVIIYSGKLELRNGSKICGGVSCS